ncbi:MAG TPA: DUF1338 domain-containing protein [Alphaproteobacteria bacterium]|nr:DUF1338 domain-containing protein [Alphaproteobacteria bacterium]
MSNAYILDRLLAIMWTRYKKRVPYAAKYQEMVEQRGGTVQNDHIAFRTFNTNVGAQPAGVAAIVRIFEPLGYRRKDTYLFEDKKLTAWHWEHESNPANPKLFISQLEVDQLSLETAGKIKTTVANGVDLILPQDLELLKEIAGGKSLDRQVGEMLADNLANFFARPWNPPLRGIPELVDKESQYAAWTLLHGNSVNHFTAYINEQHVKEWADIEATTAALIKAGVPMKSEFEGERGTKLRQTSTKAAMEDVQVTEPSGIRGKVNWSYAYYELAERGNVPGTDGKPTRFHGFLGAQATNLFEMTKRS